MNENALTLTVGVAGILAAWWFPWWFYRSGLRKARAENASLHKEIAGAREVLQNFMQVRSRDAGRDVVESSASAASAPLSDAAVEELLRASLGALVNERGNVDMVRLKREVAAVVGASHLTDALAILRRLRDQGVVWWDNDADNLAQVPVLHVKVLRSTDDENLSRIDNS